MDPPAGPEKGSGPPSYQSLSYLLETGIRVFSQKRKRDKLWEKCDVHGGGPPETPLGGKNTPPGGGGPEGQTQGLPVLVRAP